MIRGLVVLLGCQLVGEVLARGLALPVPGPVLGMALLVVLLTWRTPTSQTPVVSAADGLLKHLQLLFVPAAVGALSQLEAAADHVGAILAAGVLSWVAGLLVTAWVASALNRRSRA